MEWGERIRSLVGERVSLQLSYGGYASGKIVAFNDDGEIELSDARSVDGRVVQETTFVRSYEDVFTITVTR